MFRPRVPAGSRAGGRFAARARGEANISLGDGPGWNELYHGMTRGLMPLEQQRLLARWCVGQAFKDGTVDLMLGTSGAGHAAVIREAALSDEKLDGAVAALAALEESRTARIRSTALGFHLCKQLLLSERDLAERAGTVPDTAVSGTADQGTAELEAADQDLVSHGG